MKILSSVFIATIAILAIATPVQASVIYFQPGGSSTLTRIDTTSGIETTVGDMGLGDSWGFTFSPTGTLYGFHRASQSLYTINTSTAALTLVGTPSLTGVEALTFDATGTQLFVTSGSTLYSLNPANAAATSLGNIGTTLDGLSVTPTSQNVQGIGMVAAGSVFGVDSGSLYLIDTVTPGSTFIGNIDADETLAFAPDGTLIGHNDNGQFRQIDLSNLTSSALVNTSSRFVFASAVQPGFQAVPEPSAIAIWCLVGVGGIGMVVYRNRKGACQE